MSRLLLNFPSYEFLKALPKTRRSLHVTNSGDILEMDEHIEYTLTLFETPTSVYGRFTLNEDASDYIYFDVMEDGYCDHNSLGRRMKFNKKNYKAICKYAQSVYDLFFETLEKDLSSEWKNKSIDEFVECFGN